LDRRWTDTKLAGDLAQRSSTPDGGDHVMAALLSRTFLAISASWQTVFDHDTDRELLAHR
jgi:hypothetical protein